MQAFEFVLLMKDTTVGNKDWFFFFTTVGAYMSLLVQLCWVRYTDVIVKVIGPCASLLVIFISMSFGWVHNKFSSACPTAHYLLQHNCLTPRVSQFAVAYQPLRAVLGYRSNPAAKLEEGLWVASHVSVLELPGQLSMARSLKVTWQVAKLAWYTNDIQIKALELMIKSWFDLKL